MTIGSYTHATGEKKFHKTVPTLTTCDFYDIFFPILLYPILSQSSFLKNKKKNNAYFNRVTFQDLYTEKLQSKEEKIVLGCVIALCLITCKLLTQNKAKSV